MDEMKPTDLQLGRERWQGCFRGEAGVWLPCCPCSCTFVLSSSLSSCETRRHALVGKTKASAARRYDQSPSSMMACIQVPTRIPLRARQRPWPRRPERTSHGGSSFISPPIPQKPASQFLSCVQAAEISQRHPIPRRSVSRDSFDVFCIASNCIVS